MDGGAFTLLRAKTRTALPLTRRSRDAILVEQPTHLRHSLSELDLSLPSANSTQNLVEWIHAGRPPTPEKQVDDEAIAKKKHTPPMNAFENGLPLTEQFVADTSVLVVASHAPIEGVDDLTDCASTPSEACLQIAEILQKNTPTAAPTSTLRMRHMETETAAFGSMNSGTTLSAVSFPIMGR